MAESNAHQALVALLREGVALHQSGRHADAERIFDAVLAKDQTNADALNLKGVVAFDRGRATEAVALYDRAIAAAPRFAQLYFNKGNALSALNRVEDALQAYAQAVALQPDYADARLNAGLLLEKAGRLEDTIGAFRSMTAACPKDARGYYNLGVCLEKLLARKNIKTKVVIPEAFAAFEKALDLAPQDASIHCALGTLCSRLGDYKQALIHTERATRLNPDWSEAWVNLGGHKEALGDRVGALAAFDHALQLDPANAGADVNRGLTLLSLGRLTEGWRGYARRFEDARFPFVKRTWPWPAWNGESLQDRAILLWSDQGIGDEILYSGMIPEVAARARLCVVECSARLEPLYKRSFPNAEIVIRNAAVTEALRGRRFDFHSSVLDIGQWLRPSLSAFPNRSANMVADRARAALLRSQYLERSHGGALVGLSWRSINPAFGAQKSVGLSDFVPLLKADSLMFINVQYGDTSKEVENVSKSHGVSLFQDAAVDPFTDLDGLAAQLSALDLVVTVSNTTAHLAAALGVPTWLYVPDGRKRLWYWFDAGNYSPWYRSVWAGRSPLPGALNALSAALAP